MVDDCGCLTLFSFLLLAEKKVIYLLSCNIFLSYYLYLLRCERLHALNVSNKHLIHRYCQIQKFARMFIVWNVVMLFSSNISRICKDLFKLFPTD